MMNWDAGSRDAMRENELPAGWIEINVRKSR
jgi:hypothetical protein